MRGGRWIIVVAGLGLRLGLLSQPLDALDYWFVPDDTYYTLTVARSIAHGLGPTVDGVVLTNGFQPLIAFLYVPLFLVFHGPDAPLRAALLFTALADVAVIVLLGAIAERLAGRLAGILTSAAWAISPLAIHNALNGLETSLALALELLLVWLCLSERRDLRWWVAVGVSCGLCLLARVDSVFLVAAIGIYLLMDGRRRWSHFAMTIVSAVVVVAPWWSYSLLRFGTLVPESGPAVRQITQAHYTRTIRDAMVGVGSILGAPFTDLGPFTRPILAHPPLPVIVFALALILVIGGSLRWLLPEDCPRAAGAFALHAITLLIAYPFYLPAFWFFYRYLSPCHALLALIIGIAAARAWTEGRFILRFAPVLMAAMSLVCAETYIGQLAAGTRRPANGYRQAVLALLPRIPPGSVIGALQSGALTYYAPPGVKVVNLDGVVDRYAFDAERRRVVADYAAVRGVTHLADWPINIRNFRMMSVNAHVVPTSAKFLAAAPTVAGITYLYEVHWKPRNLAVPTQRK